VHEYKFPNKDYDSLDEVLTALMAEITVEAKIIVLAIAGANVDRKVSVTNIPRWPIVDAEELKQKFGFDKFYLLNDFEANGYGAVAIDITNEEKVIVLHEGVSVN